MIVFELSMPNVGSWNGKMIQFADCVSLTEHTLDSLAIGVMNVRDLKMMLLHLWERLPKVPAD